MNRRTVLATIGVALPTVALSGCLGTRPDEVASGEFVAGAISDGDSQPKPESHGPVRGGSEPITAQFVEDDEHVTYVPSEDSVRFVAAWRHTNHEEVEDGAKPEREPVYDTTPYEQWAQTECHFVAARAAADHVRNEFGTDDISGGVTSTIEGEDLAAVVSISSVLDRDGAVRDEPEIDFEQLVSATPKNVHSTYVLGEKESELTVPVYVREMVMQLD